MNPRDRKRPKYALAEVERRWLVEQRRLEQVTLGAATRIRDRYLPDSRLRLRRAETAGGEVIFKLCKKYGDVPAGAESVTNLYLSATEYALIAALPGWVVEKLRYPCLDGSLDHYQRDDDCVWVFERELADPGSAGTVVPPDFVTREITGDGDFSGAALARRFGTRSSH